MLVIPSAATCHSKRNDLSFRAQRRVIPSAATGHSERSDGSFRAQRGNYAGRARPLALLKVTIPDGHRSLASVKLAYRPPAPVGELPAPAHANGADGEGTTAHPNAMHARFTHAFGPPLNAGKKGQAGPAPHYAHQPDARTKYAIRDRNNGEKQAPIARSDVATQHRRTGYGSIHRNVRRRRRLTAQIAHDARRIADGDAVIGHIAGDDRTGANNSVFTDADPV
ncbi:MAG: hypothetical protein KatS3mg058_0695 [Roseiflexus sp.]|nr:MAG: hypothetical protein KatS3mg058_0695 [Roseiflexus sp.]